MSTKRVHFNKKKTVKKYDREEHSDSDSRGSNGSNDEAKTKKFHSLDSDEEDEPQYFRSKRNMGYYNV